MFRRRMHRLELLCNPRLWIAGFVLSLCFAVRPAAAHEVKTVAVVNERGDGIESKIWVYDTLTREKNDKPVYTDPNGVLSGHTIRCKKNEVVFAEPVNDVYGPDDRQQKCKSAVRIVLKLSSVATTLFLEGERLSAQNDFAGAAAVYAEAAERGKHLYPNLAEEAERLSLLSLGQALDVPSPLQFDVSENRYVPAPQAKKALLSYQTKHALPPSGEFDETTRAALAGRKKDDFLFAAYASSDALKLNEAGRYQVFFDVGKADVAGAWADIVAKAVNRVDKKGAKRVVVSGYADRPEALGGSAAWSLISELRAKAVRDALVAAGLDPKLVAVEWYGEKNPLGSNPDGLSEPINRRAEITIVSQ